MRWAGAIRSTIVESSTRAISNSVAKVGFASPDSSCWYNAAIKQSAVGERATVRISKRPIAQYTIGALAFAVLAGWIADLYTDWWHLLWKAFEGVQR